MDDLRMEKIVTFLGSWQSSKLSDVLSYEISKRANDITGRTAKITLSKNGLMLHVRNELGQIDQTDLIPIQSVYDILVNNYNTHIIMCLMRQKNRGLNIVTLRCRCELDSFEIRRVFRLYRKSLSVEGYNVNFKKQNGQNWSLGKKTIFRYEQNGGDLNSFVNGKQELIVKRKLESVPTEVTHIGIQTDLAEDDLSSVSSTEHSGSLPDKLSQLSDEVKAMNISLERENEISSPQYYRKDVTVGENDGRQVVYRHLASSVTTSAKDTAPHGGAKMRNGSEGRANDEGSEYDIRDFAVQTCSPETQEQNYIQKSSFEAKLHPDITNANHLQARTLQRSRATSELSDIPNGNFLRYGQRESRNSQSSSGKILTFITPPPERQQTKMDGMYLKAPSQRSSLREQYFKEFSSTVPKTIENVYPLRKKHRRRSAKYRQIVTQNMLLDDVMYQDPVHSLFEMQLEQKLDKNERF